MHQNLSVEPYKSEDFSTLVLLHERQGSDTAGVLTAETLPALGFKAVIDTDVVAFGFLRMVEGGFAQFDTLVTNPNYPSDTRHLAVSMLVQTIIDTAKLLKLKGLIAHTTDKTIISRAVETGFHVTPYTLIALPL